jgi:hypothetical protein
VSATLLLASQSTGQGAGVSTSVVSAAIGVLVGGSFAYLGARLQVTREDRRFERRRLLELRTDPFSRLWGITSHLRLTPDPAVLDGSALPTLGDSLNNWYFDDGGILLSNTCRDAYFSLLEALSTAHEQIPLDPDRYQELYNAATQLRTALATELDTRTSVSPGYI